MQVDSLKDQLDEKHKELVKMQESNQDLKSRLQTVVREKDISQVRLHKLLGSLLHGLNPSPKLDTNTMGIPSLSPL